MLQATSRPTGPRRLIATIAWLILFGLTLTVTALAFNALAATTVGCMILSATLLLTLRSLRREREMAEKSVQRVHQKYNSIVSALTVAMGLRDDMSASHARRVSDLSFILAQQMRVGHEETQPIQRAAGLADIGKMERADGVLAKAGALTEPRWA